MSLSREGTFNSKFDQVRFVLHGFENGKFSINGTETSFENEELCLFPPVSHFDPVIDPEPAETEDVLTATVKLESRMELSW